MGASAFEGSSQCEAFPASISSILSVPPKSSALSKTRAGILSSSALDLECGLDEEMLLLSDFDLECGLEEPLPTPFMKSLDLECGLDDPLPQTAHSK
jgi:hypothetical protein